MVPAIAPTPRDDRIRVLSSQSNAELQERAHALGYLVTGRDPLRMTSDEWVAIILDVETDLGFVAPR